MHAFPTEKEIRQTVHLLIDKYKVNLSMLINFIGKENYKQLTLMLEDLEEGEMDEYQLARTVIVNKGPYLFAGSHQAVRELRSHLLRQLDDDTVINLYTRNPISGKNIKSPSYMYNSLANKKWTMGGRWPKDFIKTLGFPLVFLAFLYQKTIPRTLFRILNQEKCYLH